jgi:LysR family glycine cleavage system transcriptional activator
VTLLPSFAQRWLLPRVARWRERHPDIAIELHTSQELMDLRRQGFHAALRLGAGQWKGLEAEKLIDSPLIVVGAPAAAARVAGRRTAALASEPLLGDAAAWTRWFALDGCRCPAKPVASFNDAGLMLQAAEQDIGIALARELLAADALRDGRLVRLSPLALVDESVLTLWLAYPAELRHWAPLVALRNWLRDEMSASQRELGAPAAALAERSPLAARSTTGAATAVTQAAGKAAAGPTGSRSRVRSAAGAARRRAR